jgi:hypothetical protein
MLRAVLRLRVPWLLQTTVPLNLARLAVAPPLVEVQVLRVAAPSLPLPRQRPPDR